jgi:uncharacterized protein DUF3826
MCAVHPTIIWCAAKIYNRRSEAKLGWRDALMPRLFDAIFRAILASTFAIWLADCSVAANTSDNEAAYTQDITKRADKIVNTLGISDDAHKIHIRDLIAQQYRTLREIHAARDARISETKQSPSDANVAEGVAKMARDAASLKLAEAHRRFVARLSVELTPEQLDKVKDGLTYGVVGITYKRYLELFPAMKEEDKREILADLVEARESAMDAGKSEEKHAIFGKYKGRINNYLSKAGYDMKQAEKALADKEKTASKNR